MAARIDARHVQRAQMLDQLREHRPANAAPLPIRPYADVIELRHERAACGRYRETHDARADSRTAVRARALRANLRSCRSFVRRTKRHPHKAKVGTCQEQIEGSRQSFRSAVAVPCAGS